MKRFIAGVLTVLVWSQSLPAQESASGTPLQIYPWSEKSETVRLDKKLLEMLPVTSVTRANTGTGQFVPTEEFITIFKVTPAEVEQITAALDNAAHEYRTVESANSEPSPAPPTRGGPAAGPDDRTFSFRVKPFPGQAADIRAKLEESVRSALGEQRARIFWKNDFLLDSQFPEMKKEQNPAAGIRMRSYTFVLPAKEPGSVYLHTADEWRDLAGRRRGSGSERNTFPTARDRYAPESIRPIIAEWRKKEGSTALAATAPAGSPVLVATPVDDINREKWDNNAAYIDVPKSVLHTIRLPGLTVNEELPPELKAALGLAEDDQKAVMQLYDQLKREFEKVERDNFHRVEPGKNRFVIRAFRQESEALKQQWKQGLAKLLGSQRAALLNDRIQKGRTVFFHGAHGRMLPGGVVNNGPTWLDRGTEEAQLNITVQEQDGRRQLKWDYSMGGGRLKANGSQTTSGGVPQRWQHLLTPDMLGLPLAL